MAADIPTIDSHIHLYPESALPTLAWCKPSHPLAGPHSLQEYHSATSSSFNSLKGFILIESDRKNDLATGPASADPANAGWKYPLQETAYYAKVAAEASTKPGPKCLAIVPWAPVPSGKEAVEEYLELCEEAAGEQWDLVKGFRYLLQDKDAGTMLEEDFVEGVKVLGKRGFVFEVGIDIHRRGKKQVEEMVELIDRCHEGVEEDEKVTFVINHMMKPDLTIYNTADPAFTNWRNAIYTLSKCDRAYMKLSGGFSEMPEALKHRSPSEIFQALFPWLGVMLATFGVGKIMFGSDWPVCTIGIETQEKKKDVKSDEEEEDEEEEEEEDEERECAWAKWKAVVDKMCWMASLEEDDMKTLYGGTAAKAYGIGRE